MRRTGIAFALLAVLLAGCTVPIEGRARREDPAAVVGLGVTDGPSGPKPGAPPTDLKVDGSDGGEIDALATAAVADVERYWAARLPETFGQEYVPVIRLVSYDSGEPGPEVCGATTEGLVNAFYCGAVPDVVAWDRGELLPELRDSFGPVAVMTVLAHELGHAVQFRLGVAERTPTIVKEQQADCYTGAYFRWVAEGESPAFRITTGEGLNQALSTLFLIRDSAEVTFDAEGAHGNAFDRVSAFQIGFTDGPARCARIDTAEIEARSTQRESGSAASGEPNLRLDSREAQEDLAASLRQAFDQTRSAPALTTGPTLCEPTGSPAAFCSASNQVGLNLPELVRIGTPSRRGRPGGLGDFAAFAEVASRYTLSVQQEAGHLLEGPVAAQRTACLTGFWAATLSSGADVPLRLSPGDLDEAVAEMLAPASLIAADARGEALPAGFARVAAFRDGFAAAEARVCSVTYP
ncbi:neutral zinc metallopeptidase [Saccharothrix sp. AJ9571]|nr:neutral zinc metallopeptidase [Saccharothrix sp. AJ9571]